MWFLLCSLKVYSSQRALPLTVDGWILFRPEALSLKGLGTLITYDSSPSALNSYKPSTLSPSLTPPLASCLDY